VDLLTEASIPVNAHKIFDLKTLADAWRRLGLAMQGIPSGGDED
jgi:hypothetical protein